MHNDVERKRKGVPKDGGLLSETPTFGVFSAPGCCSLLTKSF